MATTGEKTKKMPHESDLAKIDRHAPARGESSSDAESVRDGGSATDDSIMEILDEETPPLADN
jgi:hypothetical protein